MLCGERETKRAAAGILQPLASLSSRAACACSSRAAAVAWWHETSRHGEREDEKAGAGDAGPSA